MRRIEVVRGDITEQEVHVIVNAAHEGLCGGGGVDGAIHKAAGPMMTGECMNLPFNSNGERCPVGSCRMTGGYDLPALYIIHTVGPVWRGGEHRELIDLSTCYRNVLFMVQNQGLHSVAFPCISTGAFAVPKSLAAKQAVDSVRAWIGYQKLLYGKTKDDCSISLIRFVCFDDENYDEYLKLFPDGYEEMNW